MVYLCLSLLILVLLGELLVTLDDVGALGFAKNLYSEELPATSSSGSLPSTAFLASENYPDDKESPATTMELKLDCKTSQAFQTS